MKLFVEFSDGMVYGKASSGGSKETDNTKPSVVLAKYKLLAEEELKKVPGYGHTFLLATYQKKKEGESYGFR